MLNYAHLLSASAIHIYLVHIMITKPMTGYRPTLLNTLHIWKILLILSAITLLISLSFTSQASTSSQKEFETLQKEVAVLSHLYYQEAAKELKGTFYIKRSVKALKSTIINLVNNNQHALANAVILANFPLIKKHIDSREMPIFLAQLLKHNIWKSADNLAQHGLNNGRYFSQSKIHYLLAEYYFSQNNIDKTVEHLTSIESSKPLSKKERDYATLLFGISLQKKKKHREALKIYDKIIPESEYYGHSRLNIATAHIRQGWWTDAQIAIEEALQQKAPESQKEINNRLLLILGYSQLQHEFYRNARKTFRRVSLDSQYMNRALHGIGLCALSQKDFPGAINAFSHLQTIENTELPTLESYLLVPYTYNRMDNLDQAAAGYSEAIAFYEIKTRELNAQVDAIRENLSAPIQPDMLALLPDIEIQTHQMLNELDIEQSHHTTQKKIRELKAKLNRHLATKVIGALQKKSENLKSYLSQSQYGLAKLYDAP